MILGSLRKVFPPCLCLCLCLGLGSAAFAQKLEHALVLEGKVHYAVVRTVRNGYPGRMKSIAVKDGQTVRRGEVLGQYAILEFDRQDLQRRLASTDLLQKRMKLDEARSQLRALTRGHASLVKMFENGMVSQMEVDRSEDRIEQAKELVRYCEEDARHEEERLDLERKKISTALGGMPLESDRVPKIVSLVAPFDSTVIWRIDAKHWGLGKSTICFKVADITHLVLKAKVFVEDYPHLAEGMVATVTARGQPGKKFKAVLSKLPMTPIDKGFAALSYYLVEFEMDNSDQLFREGYRVTVTLPPQSVGEARGKPVP